MLWAVALSVAFVSIQWNGGPARVRPAHALENGALCGAGHLDKEQGWIEW